MKNKSLSKIHKLTKFVDKQYLILTFFWSILCALLIFFLIWFMGERGYINNQPLIDYNDEMISINETLAKINNGEITTALDLQNVYHQMMNVKYPLIDFSLMSFFPTTQSASVDYITAWKNRVTSIDTAYSYVFITMLIALIGLVFYFVISVQIIWEKHVQKKYDLSTNYLSYFNSYGIFNIKIYLDFIVNLTIVFSFFNFLTTAIIIGYGVLLLIISYFNWYILKKDVNIFLQKKWWKSTNFVFLASVLIIQNTYTLLSSIFANQFGVNLDLILQIIIPVGTITVIIAVFIKNMLSNSVIKIKKDIKTINVKVSAFQLFYYTKGEDALNDYNFVSQLPPLIKNQLLKNLVDNDGAMKLMNILNETTIFIQRNVKKENEQKFLLYRLYNQVGSVEEIKEIKTNINKKNQYHRK